MVFSPTTARTASCAWVGSTLFPGFARQARAEMGPVRHDAARRAWRSGSKRCAQRWASRCTRGKGCLELRVAPFWGAEVDGERGYVRHGRKKGHALVLSTLLLLGTPRWTVTPLQHCVGLITFAVGFRRPLFALVESVYKEVTDHYDFRPFSPSDTAVTELLLAALCVPLAAVDLRLPIRPVISTSDASHVGGGAAEVRSFRPNLNPAVQAFSEAQAEEANEKAAFVGKGLTCHPCCFSVAGNSATAPCPWRCGFGSCSPQCYVVHMNECRLRSLPVHTVALYLDSPTRPLSWTLAQCGTAVVFDPHGVISQRSLGKDGVLRDGGTAAGMGNLAEFAPVVCVCTASGDRRV